MILTWVLSLWQIGLNELQWVLDIVFLYQLLLFIFWFLVLNSQNLGAHLVTFLVLNQRELNGLFIHAISDSIILLILRILLVFVGSVPTHCWLSNVWWRRSKLFIESVANKSIFNFLIMHLPRNRPLIFHILRHFDLKLVQLNDFLHIYIVL